MQKAWISKEKSWDAFADSSFALLPVLERWNGNEETRNNKNRHNPNPF
jgi:hypothetical protein